MMLLLLVVALFRHPNGHSNVSRALPGQADFTHTHTHTLTATSTSKFSFSSHPAHPQFTLALSARLSICCSFYCLSLTHTLSHKDTHRQALQIANNYFLKCCKRPAYLWHIDLPSCNMPDNVPPQSNACKQASLSFAHSTCHDYSSYWPCSERRSWNCDKWAGGFLYKAGKLYY